VIKLGTTSIKIKFAILMDVKTQNHLSGSIISLTTICSNRAIKEQRIEQSVRILFCSHAHLPGDFPFSSRGHFARATRLETYLFVEMSSLLAPCVSLFAQFRPEHTRASQTRHSSCFGMHSCKSHGLLQFICLCCRLSAPRLSWSFGRRCIVCEIPL